MLSKDMAVVARNHSGLSYHPTSVQVTQICLPLSNNLAADSHHPTQHISVSHAQASKPTHTRKRDNRLDEAAVQGLKDTAMDIHIAQMM